MSGIGSQAGGFSSPNIPLRQEELRPAIQRVTSPAPSTVEKAAPDLVPEEIVVQKELDHKSDVQTINDRVKNERSRQADSFHSANQETQVQEEQVAKFAGQVLDKKQLEASAKEYAKKINQSQVSDSFVPNKSSEEVSTNQQLASTVAQAQSSDIDPDAQSKSKNKLEPKLEKIVHLGGEKGQAFVGFIRRQLSRGELSDSMLQLVDDYLQSVTPDDSLSTSALLASGKEPTVTLRGMMSVNNKDEHGRFNKTLSNLVANSAGERIDLLLARNKNIGLEKTAPPKPLKPINNLNTQELAARYINSISQAGIAAPWDNLMLAV